MRPTQLMRTVVGPANTLPVLLVWLLYLQVIGFDRAIAEKDLPEEDVLEVQSDPGPGPTLRPKPPQPPRPPTPTKAPEPGPDHIYRVTYNSTDCIRALFKINLTVEYACLRARHNTKRLYHRTCRVDIALPDPREVAVSGQCGPEPILVLAWSARRISLTFKFSRTADEWFADHLDFSFDPKDKHFPNASEKQRKTLSAEKSLRLFKAPLNRSYFCNATEIVDLGLGASRHAGVAITESQVQVFELPGGGTAFSEPHECPADNERPRSPITAFVIASCLALMVILIIAGYYFSRRNNPSSYATVD